MKIFLIFEKIFKREKWTEKKKYRESSENSFYENVHQKLADNDKFVMLSLFNKSHRFEPLTKEQFPLKSIIKQW